MVINAVTFVCIGDIKVWKYLPDFHLAVKYDPTSYFNNLKQLCGLIYSKCLVYL